MNITLKQLKSLYACSTGYEWLKAQKNREVKHILRQCVIEGHADWAQWYTHKLFTKPQAVAYSIFCAEQCIDEYEKAYSDKGPRQAIEAAKRWLVSPTEENRSAAESAACSAESAAWSARSAAWSAESAAWSARSAAWSAARSARSAAESAAWSARSAAWSARSAARSARSAARSAAWSAAWFAQIEQAILILGL